MNKYFCLSVLLSILLYACSDDSTPSQMDGQWQLQTISLPDGTVSEVDTVFYSFQHEVLFSFNILLNPDSSNISLGYIDFPSTDKVHIAMDTTGLYQNRMENVKADFLKQSGWESYEKEFTIRNVDGKKMELEDSFNKIYTFKKY